KNAPFFRNVPGVFNLDLTRPFGLNGNVPDLQTFSTDAVTQHFPKTLARSTKGQKPDFVLPTSQQLKDLEAFMLLAPELRSPGVPALVGFDGAIADGVLVNTVPEIRGRNAFLSIGCTQCHLNTVFADGNFNTNVDLAEKTNSSLVTIPANLRTPT